ncbi:MAG: response regulator transcription factor [Clostridiales bacterium]|nr:response regulator transcription factor [Clostridiales bacterium]
MGMLIYAVEDDDNIRELIKCTLRSFSYDAEVFSTAEDMFVFCRKKSPPELFLLDIMLPGMSGIDALKQIRSDLQMRKIPVILLTAKSLETDKVIGLDNGADDYITKPFGILELMARIRAIQRRILLPDEKQHQIIQVEDLLMDIDRHEVRVKNEEIPLTLKEFELLYMLLANRGKTVTRDELLNTVWGFDFQGESRTLDMHIKTLRQKIGDNAENPKYIKTVRGIGYIIV